jgi:LysR family glycine cleavage system transcriptional activator
LLEEDDHRPSAEYLSWHRWLRGNAPPGVEPKGWMYLNFTYQQIQAALAGQGVALARHALVGESIARGELVEPFGAAGRITSPFAYWLVVLPGSRHRPEVQQFCEWVQEHAVLTREAIGDAATP